MLDKDKVAEFGNEATWFTRRAGRAPGTPFSWEMYDEAIVAALPRSPSLEQLPPSTSENSSGLAEARHFPGYKTEAKTIRLGPWAPAQQLISLRPSNFVCACCPKVGWVTKTEASKPQPGRWKRSETSRERLPESASDDNS